MYLSVQTEVIFIFFQFGEWLHYFLEDTFVPISTSAHHAVISLSRHMQAWIWRVVSAGYFTVICAKESKQPRKAGPKSWDMLLAKILLLEDLLLYNEHLRSSICNKKGRRKGKYLSYANSHSTWSHCEGFCRNKVHCHGEMELVPIIARKPMKPSHSKTREAEETGVLLKETIQSLCREILEGWLEKKPTTLKTTWNMLFTVLRSHAEYY